MNYNRANLRSESANNLVETLKNVAGVYQIKLKESEPIQRLISKDDNCVIYVGHAKSSNGLLKRLRDFYDSASNLNSNNEPPTTHQAGRAYQLYMKEHLGNALEVLEFDFTICATDDDAVKLEADKLYEYLSVFAELPPLNNQIPK